MAVGNTRRHVFSAKMWRRVLDSNACSGPPAVMSRKRAPCTRQALVPQNRAITRPRVRGQPWRGAPALPRQASERSCAHASWHAHLASLAPAAPRPAAGSNVVSLLVRSGFLRFFLIPEGAGSACVGERRTGRQYQAGSG